MVVPNTITRMIDKKGNVVTFKMSKIHNAIAKAISDVERAPSWEAKERALKYAELVRDRIFQKFYDLEHLIKFFSQLIISFDKSERVERISRTEFASRLVTLLYLHYTYERQIMQNDDMEKRTFHEEDLLGYVQSQFRNHLEENELLQTVSDIFSRKIIKKHDQGITKWDQYPSRDFIQDMIEGLLKDIGETFVAEGFMIFREGKRKIKQNEITEAQFTHNGIHHDRLRKTLLWNIQNECDSIFSLNQWVVGKNGKNFKELMRRSDQRFHDDIVEVANNILSKACELKVVIVAGPSCSNKTTITTIIEQELQKHGLGLKQLNIDDYFFNLSEHPKDEFGDYDFEMPEAIDMDLLNDNLRDLLQEKTVMKPHYNFHKGGRDGFSEFKVRKDEIILIDCLHGLYNGLTEAVPMNRKFKIYTESANMLRNTDGSYTKWTDIRLVKRMIRDSLYRNHDVAKTLAHWIYVRKGELKHIIPYIYSVDAVLNSGLPYEIPILKAALADKLPTAEYLKQLRYEGRLDAYVRGMRLLALFDTVFSYEDLDDVSPYSPIREFIGGSKYELAHNVTEK